MFVSEDVLIYSPIMEEDITFSIKSERTLVKPKHLWDDQTVPKTIICTSPKSSTVSQLPL